MPFYSTGEPTWPLSKPVAVSFYLSYQASVSTTATLCTALLAKPLWQAARGKVSASVGLFLLLQQTKAKLRKNYLLLTDKSEGDVDVLHPELAQFFCYAVCPCLSFILSL